ncbi:MAG: AraC family transcriptional regulator [Pseudomonadota bacterium]
MSDPNDDSVRLFEISQATSATFSALYVRQTSLFFVLQGTKRVQSARAELLASAGDLLVFPPRLLVSMENRPDSDAQYRAVGLSYADDLVATTFGDAGSNRTAQDIQIVRNTPLRPHTLLPLIQDTLSRADLPPALHARRVVEPLIWLREAGYHIALPSENDPIVRVRQIIETDLRADWRADAVAAHLNVSASTMRRTLAQRGTGFAKILLSTKLEHSLSMLHTTALPVSEIAERCGFKTPSHFADAFRSRFGIRPRDIRHRP